MGHKWLKKKRVSLVEKNVRKTERFFDNHDRAKKNYDLSGMQRFCD
jgi:hypothetical protein